MTQTVAFYFSCKLVQYRMEVMIENVQHFYQKKKLQWSVSMTHSNALGELAASRHKIDIRFLLSHYLHVAAGELFLL